MKNIRERLLFESDLLVDKLPDGQLEVRKVIIDEDGVPIYHRHVVIPGGIQPEDDARVKILAQRVHTPEVTTKFWVEEQKRQIDAER